MRRRRAVTMIAVVIGLLLGTEGLVRGIEPGLSSAGAWPKGRIAEQFDLVSRHAEGRGPVDVVFAGSSMIQRGADPRLFSQRTGLSSLNAALPASTNFMLEPWLLDVVVPRLHPEVVVIGVASRDFNDNGNGPDRALDSLLRSPGYRSIVGDDWLTDLDREASRVSALVRMRRSLREPSNVLSAIRSRRPLEPSRRCPPRSPAAERYQLDETVRRYPRTVLNDYSSGGIQTRSLIRTITELKRRGIRVVIVQMATSPDYDGLHPHGRNDVKEYDASLRRVVRDTGVTLIDATALATTRFFRDAIHLNCAGVERFTSTLAQRWGTIVARDGRSVDLYD